jgi:hypothetical protein
VRAALAEFVDDEQFDGDELGLEFEQTPLVARFHQLMDETGRGENREAALTGGEAERQARMRLAGTGVSESDDILPGGDIFATGQFENERLVERWNGGKVDSTIRLSRSMSSSSARRKRKRT